MHVKRKAVFKRGAVRQHGAALMIMLAIVIIAATAYMVSALSSTMLQVARDKTTANALAQARDALIGRAVADTTSPGSLPCPDTNGDGSADLFSGNQCPYYIGRLPWKTLGLPDPRDGSGEELWYALSPNFRDFISVVPINSDTQGTLTITGSVPASNVIAIVFAPGSVLSGQSRSTTQISLCNTTNSVLAENLCATNYLEGSNANQNTSATPNTSYQTAAASSTFNDQMTYITHDQLFASVEMRIAREIKKCLDDYATADANKYPWASPDTSYTGTNGTLFGWIPSAAAPNNDSYSDPTAQTLANALIALQEAEGTVNANPTSANNTILDNAATAVWKLRNSVSGVDPFTIYTAANDGWKFEYGTETYAGATTAIQDTYSALDSVYPPTADTSMPNNWTDIPSCNTVFNPTSDPLLPKYWPNWQQSVFYQIAQGYQPGGAASCTAGSTCLTINGSGNTTAGSHNDYHAAVIVGRQALAGQIQPSTNMDDYLEGSNQNPSSTTPPTFVTYKSSDTNYSTVNDLVLCLDGKNYCQ